VTLFHEQPQRVPAIGSVHVKKLGVLSVAAGLFIAVLFGGQVAGADGGLGGGLTGSSPAGLSTGVDGFANGVSTIYPDGGALGFDPASTAFDAAAMVSTDGLALAQSSYPLSQVDLLTGTVEGTDISATLSSDATTTIALAGAGVLAIDAVSLQAQASKLQASQQQKSASGCPTSAPPNTLRGGAPDIAALCGASVAAARSPAAASAVKYALTNLGVPYSQAQRNSPGYYDCSSFVSRAYQSAGVNLAPPGVNAPTTFSIANASWAVHESFGAALPGDLIEPFPDHIVMLLANGYVAQASMPGDVTNVTPVWWSEPYLSVWINPALVH
jgi:cell wall-associated NlpC family hydrolase